MSDYDNDSIEPSAVESPIEVTQHTILTEDLIKKTLEKNNIILPFKSPKMKLW